MNLQLANRNIRTTLEIASVKNEFIYVRTNQRGIGKTRALIEFAKENNYTVIVPHPFLVKIYIQEYGYNNIRNVNRKWRDGELQNLDGVGPLVFEEGVEEKTIKELIKSGHAVVTGYLLIRD
jgi:hypothetical protein